MPSDPMATAAAAPDGRSLAARAGDLLRGGDVAGAVAAARQATEAAPEAVETWLALARAREAEGDLAAAFDACDAARGAAPDAAEVAGLMARLALRAGSNALAEALLADLAQSGAASAAMIATLAAAQTQLLKFGDAHAVLRTALEADPGAAELWCALGALLCAEGRHGQSLVFFEESLRLGPRMPAALSGLAAALLATGGDPHQVRALGAEALVAAEPHEAAAFGEEHARRLLALGDLAGGWAAFARAGDPDLRADRVARIAARRWSPDTAPGGRLLLLGEEGLADEILLARAAVQVVADQPLILAVSPVWLALARRSFPSSHVVSRLVRPGRTDHWLAADLDSPHLHEGELVGAWAPLRAVIASPHGEAAGWGLRAACLTPDAAAVARWRGRVAALGPGPKVGLAWRLPAEDPAAAWTAPPLPALAGPLSTAGITLVAAKHRGSEAEAAWLSAHLGTAVRNMHDLPFEDLDALAALACALDVVVGPPGVETFLAAACGAETWIITTPGHWAMLGTETFPWFPNVRVFRADGPGEWDGALAELGEALAALAARA